MLSGSLPPSSVNVSVNVNVNVSNVHRVRVLQSAKAVQVSKSRILGLWFIPCRGSMAYVTHTLSHWERGGGGWGPGQGRLWRYSQCACAYAPRTRVAACMSRQQTPSVGTGSPGGAALPARSPGTPDCTLDWFATACMRYSCRLEHGLQALQYKRVTNKQTSAPPPTSTLSPIGGQQGQPVHGGWP